MFKFNNFIIIAVSFLSSSLYAADLMDVYNRSLKYNNQLKIISNNNQIAGEQYNQTSSTIFPDISLTANSKKIDIEKAIGYTIKDYTTETASINITQPIFRLYFFDELNKAQSQIKKSDVNLLGQKKELLIKSAKLYFSLINFKNNALVSKVKQKIMSKKFENAVTLFANGLITDIELNNHKNNLNLANIEMEISEDQLILSKQDIYIFTGREIFDIQNLDTEVNIPLNTYEKESLFLQAIKTEENIKMAKYDIEITESEMKSNKSKHYPTIDLVASYDYTDSSSGGRFGSNTTESSTLGVSLNIPIYQGGYQSSKVNESRYVFENAKINFDQLKRNMQKNITDTVNQHDLLKKLIVVKKDYYKNSNDNYLTVKKGFMLGVYSDIQVQEAEYQLVQSKNELIKVTLDYLLIDLRLKKYSSELNVKNIESINQLLVW